MMKDLFKVSKYLSDEFGTVVKFNDIGTNGYRSWDNTIFIDVNGNDWNDTSEIMESMFNDDAFTLYVLLHEAGHVIQSNDKEVNQYKLIDDEDMTSKEYFKFQFINEWNAWNRGNDLAKKLGIKKDKKKWVKFAQESLNTYTFSYTHNKVMLTQKDVDKIGVKYQNLINSK